MTRTVFISSPFQEPKGIDWRIRRQLYERLNSPPYRPWMFEIEEKREENTGKPPHLIIRAAIEKCDVVVCFLKQRLGSWMQTDCTSGPFHGTDDEIFWARLSNKPVLLYKIGDAPQPLLRGFWELFEDSRILPHIVRNLANEGDLLETVRRDLDECWVSSSSLFQPALSPDGEIESWTVVPDSLALDEIRESLLQARHRDLHAAEKVAATVPFIEESRLSRSLKIAYASLLADCGSVWANRASYDRAIRAQHLSIRYYFEAGCWENMFTQALSLAGILNMANQARSQFVYCYSTRTIFHMPQLHHLMAACHDNKASILMTSGDWAAAYANMAQVRKGMHDESSCTLSKFAVSMAAARPDRISEANDILFDHALSIARKSNRDLGYTLKWAAILALQQNERAKARAYIDEGIKDCLRVGNRHTLADIRAAESYYQLTEL